MQYIITDLGCGRKCTALFESKRGIYTEEGEKFKEKNNLGSFKKESDSRC